MNIQAWPKLELHLHLDCSLSYEVAKQLEPGLTESVFRNDFIAPLKCRNLADFLTRAEQGFRRMQSASSLRLVTLDLFRQLDQDHVIYVEIRFAPLLHVRGGLSMEEVVETVLEAGREAEEKYGIPHRWILCTLRRASARQSMDTVKLAARYHQDGVGGFDIAGNEAGYDLAPHLPAFQWAWEQGVPVTMHAGEALGAGSVAEAVHQGHTRRLGHGIRALEDPMLMEELLALSVHFEVCPSSNVQTNVVASLADHPVDRLYRRGYSVGINTDGRTLVNTTLTEEYRRLQHTFNWSKAAFLQVNLHAAEHAFLAKAEKEKLREKLRLGYS